MERGDGESLPPSTQLSHNYRLIHPPQPDPSTVITVSSVYLSDLCKDGLHRRSVYIIWSAGRSKKPKYFSHGKPRNGYRFTFKDTGIQRQLPINAAGSGGALEAVTGVPCVQFYRARSQCVRTCGRRPRPRFFPCLGSRAGDLF